MRIRNMAWALIVLGIAIQVPAAPPGKGAAPAQDPLRRLIAGATAPLAARAGLCAVVVGDTRASAADLAAALLRETNMFVHVIAPTPSARDALRRKFGGGPSADRFAVAQTPAGDRLPYTDNLLDLLAAAPASGDQSPAFLAECRRVLAPRGMLVLVQPHNGAAPRPVETALRAAGFAEVRSDVLGGWSATLARKPVPDGMDDWPQFLHGPDNNAVSHDRFIGPPRHVQWTSGPRWSRDHDVTPSIFGLVSAGGRIFYIVDEGPICVVNERLPEKRFLVARDAFNGALLWKYPLQNWYSSRLIWGHIPASAQRRVAAAADRVYLTPGLGAPVTALDAASGKPVRTYAGTEHTSEIVLEGDLLFLVIRRTSPLEGKTASRDRRRFRPGFAGLRDGGEAVTAVNTDTGKVLWRKPYHARPMTLCAGGGRVLFAEEKAVVCVDSRSGKQVWRMPGGAEALVMRDGVVIAGSWVGAPRGPAYRPTSRRATLRALSLENGRVLWSRQGVYLPTFMFFRVPMDVFVTDGGIVWGVGQGIEWNKKPGTGFIEGLDLHTGAVKVQRDMTGAFTAGHHVRCYKSKATDRYLLFNKRGIEFVETCSGKGSIQVRWLRGACRYGIMPANGLIYAPSQACVCYPETQLEGFSAVSAGAPSDTPALPDEQRLERGHAWGAPAAGGEESSEDWPMYRHDPRRSGTCPTDVPATPSVLWTRALGQGLTPPVCASGRLYVARRAARSLFALDADTGEVLWRFVAGGEIDSPPTVWKDRILFGGRDGRVYCLRASDGALVWSFLAARGERTVAYEGRPESAWPVHGSVLLYRGLVYAAAGRTSEIDGGMDVYALDPASGRAVHHTRLVGPDEQTIRNAGVPITPGRMPGAKNDILVTDGSRLYMRHVPLDPALPEKIPVRALAWGAKGPRHFLAASGFLDDTFFNRSVWQYGAYVHRSQMLTFDADAVYGVRVYSGISWNCPIWNVGEGYLLFRRPFRPPKQGKVGAVPQKGKRMLFRVPYETFAWHRTVHVLIRALVRTGRTRQSALVFAAGAPERIDPKDPLAAFEGRTEGRLLAVDAYSGEVRSRTTIPAPPVFDGMIAARSRLFLALRNGQVMCLGAAGSQ